MKVDLLDWIELVGPLRGTVRAFPKSDPVK